MTRQSTTERTAQRGHTRAFEIVAGVGRPAGILPTVREAVHVAALHAVTVTCPVCAEPITVPVVLTEVDDVDGRKRGAFTLAAVRFDQAAVREHRCPTDHDPGRRAAA